MSGLEFIEACLKALGVLFALGAVAMVLLESGIGQHDKGARPWLAERWRAVLGMDWMAVPRRVSCVVVEGADWLVRRGFEEADKTAVFNAIFVGLLFVLVPGAALLNALIGGRPFLFLYYLSLVGALAILNFAGEVRRWRYLCGLAAFYLGVSVVIVIPLYVLHSFTEVTIHNVFSHAVLKSGLVAIFWYIAAYALMLVLDLSLRRRGIDARGSAGAAIVRSALAAVPVAYVLTFLALLAGHVPALESMPKRSWPLILSSVLFTSAGFAIEVALLRAASRRKDGLTLALAMGSALITAALFSGALLYFAYAFSPGPIPLSDIGPVLVGIEPGGTRVRLDYDFWVMHLPFVPVVVLMAGLGLAWIAKATAAPLVRVCGAAILKEKPFLVGAAMCAWVSALAWGATMMV